MKERMPHLTPQQQPEFKPRAHLVGCAFGTVVQIVVKIHLVVSNHAVLMKYHQV